MEIEAGGVGADLVAAGAEQLVQRQALLLGRQIPDRDLHGFVERQA